MKLALHIAAWRCSCPAVFFLARLCGWLAVVVAAFFERARARFKESRPIDRQQDSCFSFGPGHDALLCRFCMPRSLSLGMWLIIACAYFEGCKAFVASPELSAIDLAEMRPDDRRAAAQALFSFRCSAGSRRSAPFVALAGSSEHPPKPQPPAPRRCFWSPSSASSPSA